MEKLKYYFMHYVYRYENMVIRLAAPRVRGRTSDHCAGLQVCRVLWIDVPRVYSVQSLTYTLIYRVYSNNILCWYTQW